MRRPYWIVAMVLVACLGFGVYWFFIRDKQPIGEPTTGVTTQADFSHLPEGSEVYPIDWLRATTSLSTGKPFLDHLERFGLIDDPTGPTIPGEPTRRLPVGVTLTTPIGSKMEMLGVNCAACHSTTIEYKGTKIRIDGAPNTFDITEFYQDLFESAQATFKDSQKLLTFLRALKTQGPRDPPSRLLLVLLPFLEIAEADRDSNSFEGLLLQRLRNLFADDDNDADNEANKLAGLFTEESKAAREDLAAKIAERRPSRPLLNALKDKFERVKERLSDISGDTLPMLEARIVFLRKIQLQKTLTPIKPGPGRVDAFGSARIFLFGKAEAKTLGAPVRFPAIWTLGNRHWVHWDGNTNSISERNAGQALGLGALVDTDTFRSTLLPANLYRLEDYVRKLPAPNWPEAFGKVDTASPEFAKGEAIYTQNCASCHEGKEKRETADLPDGKGKKIFANGKVLVYQIGTDDARRKISAVPLKDGKAFFPELGALQRKIKDQANHTHKTQLSHPGIKDVVDRMDALDKNPEWITNDGYIARPLKAAWASAPFLHNGSVPSIADLLKPVKDRPPVFLVGCREYDPESLGYVFTAQTVPEDQRAYATKFDTSFAGNANTGHEFGTDLGVDDKKALLLYLKALK